MDLELALGLDPNLLGAFEACPNAAGFLFSVRSKKMRLVALINLAPVSSKTDVTTSSYEGFKFCIRPATIVKWGISSGGFAIIRTCFNIKAFCFEAFSPYCMRKFEIRTCFDIKAVGVV